MSLVDFDGDGAMDVLTANGDNADYTSFAKHYHGVRIYLNDGENNFVEHRHCKPQSAGFHRSAGIRILEALGYIEVERQQNKLGKVRLVRLKGKSERTR